MARFYMVTHLATCLIHQLVTRNILSCIRMIPLHFNLSTVCATIKDEVFPFLQQVVVIIKRDLSVSVTKLRTNQGKEYLMNRAFTSFLQEDTIDHELSTVYTPRQNNFRESYDMTVMESVRSMLHVYSLPISLWVEAIHGAVYSLNWTISKQLDKITPFEAWFNKKPSVTHYKTSRALAYVHVSKEVRMYKAITQRLSNDFCGLQSTLKGLQVLKPGF